MDRTLPVTRSIGGKLRRRLAWRAAALVGVTVLALLLRLRAVEQLPPDFDEDDYLRAGQLYAQQIAAGNLAGIVNLRENYEHPPLTKLVFGALLATGDPEQYARPVTALADDAMPRGAELERLRNEIPPLRRFGALVGALTAGMVALANPLAGLLVALNSWHIKYTSQAMLEALPCFFAALCLLLLRASRRRGDLPFWSAAAGLGLAAAGTYRYGAGGFAALAWLLWLQPAEQQPDGRPPAWRSRVVPALGWIGLALLFFYLFDPALWFDPLGRLRESILFNAGYSTGSHVQEAGLPWFQPLVWLSGAVPWHPGVMPLLLDGLFALFGLLALRRMWRDDRLIVVWLLANLVFLLLWPTKWPQYILALTVPISLAAARWLQDSSRRLALAWRERRHRAWQKLRPALPWLAPSMLLFAVIALYPLALQLALAVTDFQLINLRNGLPAFWQATLRGMLALPPMVGNPLDYYGSGVMVFVWDLLPVALSNGLWVVVTMALATLLGLCLALLIEQRGLQGRGFWRALFILPWAIPEFVGALVWHTLFDDTFGGINYLLGVEIGWLSDRTPWPNLRALVEPLSDLLNSLRLAPLGESLALLAALFSPPKAFWVMCLVGVWLAFPFMMLISTAALRSLPAEIYDAARVDGAGGWLLWRAITWPLIRSAVLSGALLRGILLFNAFYIPLMAIGPANVGDGTVTLALIGYFVTVNSEYSLSAAINSLVLLVAALLIWLFNRRTHLIEP